MATNELDAVENAPDRRKTLSRSKSRPAEMYATIKGTVGRGLQQTVVSFMGLEDEEDVTITPEEKVALKYGNKWRFKTQIRHRDLLQREQSKQWKAKPVFFKRRKHHTQTHIEDGITLSTSPSNVEETRIRTKSDGVALSLFRVPGDRPSLSSVMDDGEKPRSKSMGSAKPQDMYEYDSEEEDAMTEERPFYAYFTVIVFVMQAYMMGWTLWVGGFDTFPDKNPFLGPPKQTLADYGSKQMSSINPEYFRVFISLFVHNGLLYFAIIAVFELTVGRILEERYGFLRIGPIFIISGMGGNLLSLILDPNSASTGAGGSIYGYFGILLIDIVQNWKQLPNPKRSLVKLLLVIIMLLVVGLMPLVDNFVNIGGLLFGIISSVIFLPNVTLGVWQVRFKAVLVLILLPFTLFLMWFLWYLFKLGVNFGGYCPGCQVISCLPVAGWC